MSINKEAIRQWVAALRSGEYSQTKGILRDNRGFCCLGVACDLFSKQVPNGWWMPEDNQGFIPFRSVSTKQTEGEVTSEVLTDAVAEWLGLGGDFNPSIVNGEFSKESLADANDSGMPFSQIADIIEKEYLSDGN